MGWPGCDDRPIRPICVIKENEEASEEKVSFPGLSLSEDSCCPNTRPPTNYFELTYQFSFENKLPLERRSPCGPQQSTAPQIRGMSFQVCWADSMSSCLARWQMGPWTRPNPGPLTGTSATSGNLWFYNSEIAGYVVYSHGPIGRFIIWTQNAHVFHKEWERMNKALLHVQSGFNRVKKG